MKSTQGRKEVGKHCQGHGALVLAVKNVTVELVVTSVLLQGLGIYLLAGMAGRALTPVPQMCPCVYSL